MLSGRGPEGEREDQEKEDKLHRLKELPQKQTENKGKGLLSQTNLEFQ